MATIDGSIQLVKVVTDADLRQNGGSFVVAGRMAQPIQGFDTLTKRASGGNAIPVYVVSDAQIADGTFRLKGGSALPMADIDVVGANVKTIQGTAIPVYVVSGALGAGGVPAFDPADIAGMFSRFDHTTEIYTDVAGTTPAVSNDDAVRRWNDGTGTQNATEETSNPVLRTGANGINGTRAVYFSSTFLLLTGLSVSSGPMTFYLVVDPDATPGAAAYIFDSNTGRLILCHGTVTVGKTGYFDGSFKDIADATADAQILTFVLQAAGGEMFRNGASLGSGAYAEKAIGGNTALASNRGPTGTQLYTGKMGAFYGYSGAHDAGQRLQVHEYLSDAFSINLA